MKLKWKKTNADHWTARVSLAGPSLHYGSWFYDAVRDPKTNRWAAHTTTSVTTGFKDRRAAMAHCQKHYNNPDNRPGLFKN